MTPLGDARAALAFLTRIPVHDGRPFDEARLSRAALWFPAVGLVVGVVMGATRLLSDLALDTPAATLLALLAAILITGGFHEDGLADAADGVGAHVPRARKLEILRDSRVGTYGALAVVFMVLFPYVVLVELDGEHFLRAALAAHVLGRWSTVPQSWLLGSARPDGAGALVRAGARVTLAASAYTVVLVLALGGLAPGAVALGVAVALTVLGGAFFARVLGGVSGDTFGAVNKIVELGTYAALGAMWAA